MGALLCTYESDKAIVRFYAGQRTEEERKEALKNAAISFYKAIQKGAADNSRMAAVPALHDSSDAHVSGPM